MNGHARLHTMTTAKLRPCGRIEQVQFMRCQQDRDSHAHTQRLYFAAAISGLFVGYEENPFLTLEATVKTEVKRRF